MEILKRSLFIILIYCLSVSAEMVIEEVTTSDDVETITQLPQESQFKKKSEWGAAFMSLALPGAGQLYIGKKKRALLFFSIDIALLAGSVFSESSSRNYYDNSQGYARRNSGITTTRDRDDSYWSIIGNPNFLNYKEYNWALDNNRDFDSKYLNKEDQWIWGSEEQREDYSDMRDKAGYYHTASQLFLGGMLLNRVVSFIDARIGARRYNNSKENSSLSSLEIAPRYSFANRASSVTFYYNF